MHHNDIKKVFLSVLLLCSLFLSTVYVNGSEQDKTSTDQKLENVQDQIEDAENKLDEYNDQKENLQNDLNDLNSNLQSLANDMNALETEIADTQKEIQTISDELADATALALTQQESMATRIQFMYEKGSSSLLETLLGSTSFSDFLNRIEYISYITAYDKAKLEEYQQLQISITEKKQALETEESSLLALQDDMKEKQTSVNQLISNTQSQIASTDKNLADLEQQLTEWEAYEKQLEEQKAQEDLERWQALQNALKEDFTTIDYQVQEGEAYLLAAIIQCEAEIEPYTGKIAVGNVVMNRVKSSHFPNTITGVIYQTNQFSPVASGRLAYRLEAGVNEECIRAANEVLSGKHVIDALFFRMDNGTINGTIIGNHVFY
jgi:peptidoglycan hydrolase CwlO-like protein